MYNAVDASAQTSFSQIDSNDPTAQGLPERSGSLAAPENDKDLGLSCGEISIQHWRCVRAMHALLLAFLARRSDSIQGLLRSDPSRHDSTSVNHGGTT